MGSAKAAMSQLFTWRGELSCADCTLPSTTKHVALALSLYMSERGDSAFPGATRLAGDTGLNVRTVRLALQRLVDDGWLELLERGGCKGKARHANRYRATIPNGGATITRDPRSPVSDTCLVPVIHDHPKSSSTTTENPSSSSSSSRPQATSTEEENLSAVLQTIAEHRAANTTSTIKNRTAWLAKAVRNLRDDGTADRARDILARFDARPEQIAAYLEGETRALAYATRIEPS